MAEQLALPLPKRLAPPREADPGLDRFTCVIMGGAPDFRTLIWHEDGCTTQRKNYLADGAAKHDYYFEAVLERPRPHR